MTWLAKKKIVSHQYEVDIRGPACKVPGREPPLQVQDWERLS